MTKYERNDLLRHKKIDVLLDDNLDKVQAIVALERAHTEHKNMIVEIDTASTEMNSVAEGRTKQKNNAEEALADKVAVYAKLVRAHALAVNDLNLAEKNNWTAYGLLKVADLETLSKIKEIHADAVANTVHLADYGVTAEELTEFGEDINTYEAFFGDKGMAFTDKSVLRQKLHELFDNINNLLNNRIELIMERFSITDVEFYNKYHEAKTLIDYGIRHEEPEPEDNP